MEMRSVPSGLALIAVLAGIAVPSFASSATLSVAMGKLTTCRTAVACQTAWAEFLREIGTAGLSPAAIARLQVAAIAEVTRHLGDEAAVFLADTSVQAVVLSPAFQTAAGSEATAQCNFREASSSTFCS